MTKFPLCFIFHDILYLVVRTLTGHKANVRSLDFHPYGEFVASGSNDTTVKVWFPQIPQKQ